MPYCCQCGSQVGDHDLFCAKCGARQTVTPPPADYMSGISPRTASLLCYIPWVGWLAAIIVLASQRFRDNIDVRFHAFQGLYLFVLWLIVDWAVAPLFSWPHGGHGGPIPALMKAVVLGGWIFMLIKVSHHESFKLPILGELAEKSVTEQR
jgi:uncharacterized membrane protein